MKKDQLDRIEKIDELIEIHQAVIRDLRNERNKIILEIKEKANE